MDWHDYEFICHLHEQLHTTAIDLRVQCRIRKSQYDRANITWRWRPLTYIQKTVLVDSGSTE
jgi:hypothetical protein